MLPAWPRSGSATSARSPECAPSPPIDISRRSCAINWERISSLLKPPPPTAGASGGGGGGGAATGAAAWPLPGNLTVVWHFGHFTLNARSGTRASSITILLEQLGQ